MVEVIDTTEAEKLLKAIDYIEWYCLDRGVHFNFLAEKSLKIIKEHINNLKQIEEILSHTENEKTNCE